MARVFEKRHVRGGAQIPGECVALVLKLILGSKGGTLGRENEGPKWILYSAKTTGETGSNYMLEYVRVYAAKSALNCIWDESGGSPLDH